jgi:peroxiredoxin Q/BCP
MSRWRPLRCVALWAVTMLFSSTQAAELKPGDPAPDFQLLDQHGQQHGLTRYQGQWLVLYFYPKDDTPGCTAEACEFRDDLLVLKRMAVAVIGVSLDKVQSHADFAAKYHLPFPLLSDRDGQVARAYGALFRLGPLRFAKRHTFLVDPAGRIAGIYRKVDPKTHSDQVIRDLQALQDGATPAP